MNIGHERTEATDSFDAQLLAALRSLPDGDPPADFVRVVARQARERASRAERWWLLLPGLAIVPAALYATAGYGADWGRSFVPVLQAFGGATALNWLVATAACLALSWAVPQLRPLRRR